MKLLDDPLRRVELLDIGVGLRVRAVRHEVADVLVARVPNRADTVESLIAAVAGGHDELAGPRAVAEQRPAVERGRNGDPGRSQGARRHIERDAGFVPDRAGLRDAGPADDQWDVRAV